MDFPSRTSLTHDIAQLLDYRQYAYTPTLEQQSAMLSSAYGVQQLKTWVAHRQEQQQMLLQYLLQMARDWDNRLNQQQERALRLVS